jgi:flavodoxin
VESGSRYFDHRLLLGAQHCGGQCSFVVPGVVKNEPQWLNSVTCIHDLMKTLIVCVSEHHGNTKKIAGAMAAVLDAEVSHPDDVNVEALGDYDLIGLGSGIAFGKHYQRLLEFVDALPALHAKTFVFSTRGASRGGSHHAALKSKLEAKGLTVVGEFSCRGFDTYGPMKLIGGIAKGRPNEQDLRDAEQFAKALERG